MRILHTIYCHHAVQVRCCVEAYEVVVGARRNARHPRHAGSSEGNWSVRVEAGTCDGVCVGTLRDVEREVAEAVFTAELWGCGTNRQRISYRIGKGCVRVDCDSGSARLACSGSGADRDGGAGSGEGTCGGVAKYYILIEGTCLCGGKTSAKEDRECQKNAANKNVDSHVALFLSPICNYLVHSCRR